MKIEEELEKKLREIIPEDECNWHLRDSHWIPEIIELFKSYICLLISTQNIKKGAKDGKGNRFNEQEE